MLPAVTTIIEPSKTLKLPWSNVRLGRLRSPFDLHSSGNHIRTSVWQSRLLATPLHASILQLHRAMSSPSPEVIYFSNVGCLRPIFHVDYHVSLPKNCPSKKLTGFNSTISRHILDRRRCDTCNFTNSFRVFKARPPFRIFFILRT